MAYQPLIFSGFTTGSSGGGGSSSYKNPVATESSLPAGTDGDVIVTKDTDYIWVYDGTTSRWINTGVKLASFGTIPNGSGYSLDYVNVSTDRRELRLTLQPADATNPGGVSTTTQTFGGNKTFTGTVTASNISGTNTGDVTLAAVGSTPNANSASLSGQILNLQPADGTNPGVLTSGTQTIGGNKTFTGTIAASNFSGTSSGTNTGDITLTAFGSTPSANGASLSGQALTLQPADATHPGGLSTTSQTIPGSKTFPSLLNADGGIDRSTSGTLTIGATNSTTINIGNSGATVNIQGTTIYENTPQLLTADPLITVNHGGGAGSGQNAGIEVEENAIITGYAETSSDRNSWIFKAPNTAGIATLTPGAGGITLNQSSHDPVTLSAVGAVPNANAASLSGQVLNLQPANASFPGVVTTGTQTFAGNKTFTGTISASNFSGSISGTNTGDVTLAAIGSSPNNNGATLTGQVLNLEPADATHGGVLTTGTQTIAGAKTFSGTVTVGQLIDSGLTANTVPYADGSKQLTSSAVTPTELGYLSGVTSAIQTQLNGKQATGNYITALTGDVTATGPGSVAATLATVNGNVGSFGSSTSIPSFTVNAKGLITAASGNVVIAPAGTLTGTTLAANVVSSSLTSVGTITSGTWNGTTIDVPHGGTGLSTAPSNGQLLIGNGTTYTLSTLTAGSGISIANGSGTISVTDTTFVTGDIVQTSFTAADNQSAAANVTGFAFANGTVRAFRALVSITRAATYANYQLDGIQKAASWEMSQSLVGDNTGIVFTITTAGQIQYTSTSTGSTATVKFRAITTSV